MSSPFNFIFLRHPRERTPKELIDAHRLFTNYFGDAYSKANNKGKKIIRNKDLEYASKINHKNLISSGNLNKNLARMNLNKMFTNKYRKEILEANKFGHKLFTNALYRTQTNNNRQKVLNKAKNYKNNLHSIFFILRNQGPGYGKPINSYEYSGIPKVTRNYFERNVKNFNSTGNLNANLAKLNVLIERYKKNIKNKTYGFGGYR